MSLLKINNLTTTIPTRNGKLNAVNDISFSIASGEVAALVGESGSGKSMTARSIMGLVPSPGYIASGSISFAGQELTSLGKDGLRSLRGNDIAMIFQEPMTSLNPLLKIGEQIIEPLLLHLNLARKTAIEKAVQLLLQVGITNPLQRINDYPHQLSGGMRQRIMIAMALACDPKLLIADEPTTALDVTIQAQILAVIDQLRKNTGMAMLLITHDLGIVAERADKVHVMYAGRIVESATANELFTNPLHPYTKGLLASLPENAVPGKPLFTIKGQPTTVYADYAGCPFRSRCAEVMEQCAVAMPDACMASKTHQVCCWRHQ